MKGLKLALFNQFEAQLTAEICNKLFSEKWQLKEEGVRDLEANLDNMTDKNLIACT
jgi:hypothetical protein